MLLLRSYSLSFSVLLFSASSYSESPKLHFQHYPLTEEDVHSAVESGLTLGLEAIGLRFHAASDNIGAPIQMDGADERLGSFIHSSGSKNKTTGFVVDVLTPYSWIQRQAALKAVNGEGMTVGDVTEEMKEPILRILCHPNTPVMAQQGILGVEVDSVTLRSTDKMNPEVLEPIQTERLAMPVRVGLATVTDFGPLLADFQLSEVRRIAALDKKGEFFVVIVSAEDERKDFKVKTKHFKRLP